MKISPSFSHPPTHTNASFQTNRNASKKNSGYGRLEIVDFLLKRGADPRIQNSAGQTPIDVATVNREMKALKVLQRALAERESKEEVFV